MKKRTTGTMVAIAISVVALVTSALSTWYAKTSIPNQIQKEANSYLDVIKDEAEKKLINEEALENTFNYSIKFSKYEGKVSELQNLYETNVLSEDEVRKQLKQILLEVNSDPNLQYLNNRYYKDIDSEELETLLKSIISTLNQKSKEYLSFYKIRN